MKPKTKALLARRARDPWQGAGRDLTWKGEVVMEMNLRINTDKVLGLSVDALLDEFMQVILDAAEMSNAPDEGEWN